MVGARNQRKTLTEEQAIEPGYLGYNGAEAATEQTKPDARKRMDGVCMARIRFINQI
jgi:hypothetical protein